MAFIFTNLCLYNKNRIKNIINIFHMTTFQQHSYLCPKVCQSPNKHHIQPVYKIMIIMYNCNDNKNKNLKTGENKKEEKKNPFLTSIKPLWDPFLAATHRQAHPIQYWPTIPQQVHSYQPQRQTQCDDHTSQPKHPPP